MTKLFLLPLLGAAALAPSRADACSFPSYEVKVLGYWSAGAGFDHHDPRCDLGGDCQLYGWMIAPKTGGNYPTIVFAHGSSGGQSPDVQSLEEYCTIEHRLLDEGYAVFLPFRRGVVDNTSQATTGIPVAGGRGYFKNTGIAAQDWATAKSAGNTVPDGPDSMVSWYTSYLDDETADLNHAINMLANYKRNGSPLFDATRIGVVGHSIGGAYATLASNKTYDHQPKVFASLSGAGMSWHGSQWWPNMLDGAANQHKRIIFFQRVLDESDPSLGPVDFESASEPAGFAAGFNGGSVLRKYPALNLSKAYCHANHPSMTDDQHYWCTHASFVQDPALVDIWWDNFTQFLTNHLL